MAEKFIFQFDATGLDRILAKVEQFRTSIRALGQEGAAGEGFERFSKEFEIGATKATKRIAELRQQLELLKSSLAQPRTSLTKELADLVPGVEGTGRFATGADKAKIETEIGERNRQIDVERVGLSQLLANEKQRLVEFQQREANLAQFTNRLESTRVQLLTQIASLKPGGNRLAQLVTARENLLLERQSELRRQLADESERFRRSVGPEGEKILAKELDLSIKIAAARKTVAQAERDVATAKAAAQSAGLADAEKFTGSATEEERAAALAQQISLKQQLTAAQKAEQDALQNVANLELQRVDNAQQLLSIESSGGAAVGASEILQRLQQINDAYSELIVNSEQAIRGLVGENFREELQDVEQTLKSFEGKEILSPDEEQKLASATVRAKELIDQFERIPTQGIPLPLNEDEIFRGMSLLNRLLLGAARDFGRRFTATLQFALSGALLFGAQRLVREFFQAAIEVERTFADISTSLEFDIPAPRGTAEFERVLEQVRRQVLQIADDFNALPSEVNQAAFQMISRFKDIEAAMIATRAQILATRIATIDQSEALRALTAVAESYGISLGTIADATQRQRAQARLYAQALDFATGIQQQFGISVEDTLEGSAGLAELFRSLGFSMAETFGIVATTIRTTGVTGATAFDRLGRSFGQITSPKVREELLSLANAFDEFTLAPADFLESGRTAFFKIVDQFAALDSSLQLRISQIIGQRRETQFVSAVLQGAGRGLLDEVDKAIAESAGSAEDRLITLLATLQGTIEGITEQFQELAQNLERLGVITPVKVLLTALEGVFKVVNAISKGAITVFEALNRIRLGPMGKGLGDALKFLVSMVTAALALRSLLASIRLIANVRGATTFLDLFRGVLGQNVAGSRAGQVGARIGIAAGFTGLIGRLRSADGLASKFGTTIKTLFIAPFTRILSLISVAQVRIGLWTTSILANIGLTSSAIVSENTLGVARARTAVISGLAALRGLGLVGVLGKVTGGFGFLISRAGLLAGGVLQLAGAFFAIQGILSVVLGIIKGIAGGGEAGGETIAEIEERLGAEAIATGQALTDTEKRMAALKIKTEELDVALERTFSNFGNFILQALAGFPGNIADVPGLEFNLRRERNRKQLELALLELDEVQKDLNSANKRAGGTRRNLVPELEEAQKTISEVRRGLLSLDPDDGRFTESLDALEDTAANVDGLKSQIPLISELLDGIVETILEYGEVLTPTNISEAIQDLQVGLQLGKIDLGEARKRLLFLRGQALEGITQATDPRFADPELEAEYRRSLDEVGQQDLQFFEQETAARIELTQGIEDNRARIRAELAIQLAAARQAADNPNLGPGIERALRKTIAKLELDLVRAINAEAVARGQFDVDRARTFEDRQAAYQRLREAIQAEIFLSAARRAGGAGGLTITVAEEERLAQVIQSAADDRLTQAILVAKNTTLLNASALDNLAAIAANINALRVEIDAMERRQDDDEAVRTKELELRGQVVALRLAEADRRASFFRLTAGTGDEIKAAQGELRAAQDRLKTILDLGGEDTQTAYDAELAVLRARESLAQLALRQADLQRRVNSDLTDVFAQALLDVQAAQESLRRANGPVERFEAQKALAETEARAQREFYSRRLADLDFFFQTDQLGQGQYITALRELQKGIDRTTRQGEELWREIELQIRGLIDSAEQAFNIPTEIRLPTLFEVRRALEADALGVNYQDNREQQINIFVSDDVDLASVVDQIESAFGGSIDVEAARNASGGAAITIGAF